MARTKPAPTRRAAITPARQIWKCHRVAHITPEHDADYAALMNGPAHLRPADDDAIHAMRDHGGHEVRVVVVTLGSAPYDPPPCSVCGAAMELVGGGFAEYDDFKTLDAAGRIDHAELIARVSRRQARE